MFDKTPYYWTEWNWWNGGTIEHLRGVRAPDRWSSAEITCG
jgi:hypothetical protein